MKRFVACLVWLLLCVPVLSQQTVPELKQTFSAGARPLESDFADLIDRLAAGTHRGSQATHPAVDDGDWTAGDTYVYTPDGLLYEYQSDGSHDLISRVSIGAASPGYPASRTEPGLHIAANGDLYQFDGATYTLLDPATNAAGVAANGASITVNTASIATNTANIATNVADIATKRSFRTTGATLGATAGTDGGYVTMLGYHSAGDTAPWDMIYRATGRTGVTVDGGFYIAGPGADDYWEAADKTIAYVDRFGAKAGDVAFDSRMAIQAAIDSSSNRLAFGKGKTYYIGSTELFRLQGALLIDHNDNGLRVDGNGATLYLNDGVLTTTTWLFGIHSYDGNGDVYDIEIRDLTFDANGSNQSFNGSIFTITEQVEGDKVYDVKFDNCHALNIPEDGTGFILKADDTLITNCTTTGTGGNNGTTSTGFAFSNQANADVPLEYFMRGSNLVASDVYTGFNWSGKQTNDPQNGDAQGIFTNLQSFDVHQNKTQGPWDLVINGFQTTGVGNGVATAIGLKVADVRRVVINGFRAEGFGLTGLDTETHVSDPTENILIVNGVHIEDCAAAGTSSAIGVKRANLNGVFVDCGTTGRGITLGSDCMLVDAQIHDCIAAVPSLIVTGENTRVVKLETTGTASAYAVQINATATDPVFDQLDIDKPMLGLVPFNVANTDFTAVPGHPLVATGQYVRLMNCIDATTSTATLMNEGRWRTSGASFDDSGHLVNTNEKEDGKIAIDATADDLLISTGSLSTSAWQSVGSTMRARSADPADPPNGQTVTWLSDGTGSGDDGDVMMKITDSGGTTKTVTLVDFSAS